MNLPKALAVLLPLTFTSLEAGIIDFTSTEWSGIQGQTSLVNDGIMLTAVGGTMTFNNHDGASGCGRGGDQSQLDLSSATGLACIGDGVGIKDDEITQKSGEHLIVSFLDGPVDIWDIHLLDLFAGEGTGETAFINGQLSHATPSSVTNEGGYWETGLQFFGTSHLLFSGTYFDNFSDYSVARIEYKAVPEPSIIALFSAGLFGIGLGLVRRRKKS